MAQFCCLSGERQETRTDVAVSYIILVSLVFQDGKLLENNLKVVGKEFFLDSLYTLSKALTFLALNQAQSVLALDSDKGALCHLSCL